jgi:hypothetical protein
MAPLIVRRRRKLRCCSASGVSTRVPQHRHSHLGRGRRRRRARSDAKSINVISVSCPAEISGIADSAAARDLFIAEREQILERPTAARHDQHIGPL